MTPSPEERCYCCQVVIKAGEEIWRLKDEDGLIFFAHKKCVDRDMELVKPTQEPKP